MLIFIFIDEWDTSNGVDATFVDLAWQPEESIISPFGAPTVFDHPILFGITDDQYRVRHFIITFAIENIFDVFHTLLRCVYCTTDRAIIVD